MVSVVGEMFCNPYTTELVVRRRRESLKKERYDVFDLSNNLIFTVDGGIWDIRRRRVLRDATGTPLLSMRTKGLITMRYNWAVYKGESTESEDLLFLAKEPNLLSLKTSLDVTYRQTKIRLTLVVSSQIFVHLVVISALLSNSLSQFTILFLLRWFMISHRADL
ncbi:PREDICTED: protein LURP-one-related 9-like [Camelina sativa]|uniref:Protein LURP-one-related 9-like n=1 Tax=Camelina sativa TaxID=90675 RepID=A0ABM1RCL2_CAMSA|nr:PREDICTED: protein LURP-one-related 9-like [Camelina sativa]